MKVRKVLTVGTVLVVVGVGGFFWMSGNGKKQYSHRWIQTASDEELRTGQEEIFKMILNSRDNDSEASLFQIWMQNINSELSKRAWGAEKPQPPSYHREHGNNLYKKD